MIWPIGSGENLRMRTILLLSAIGCTGLALGCGDSGSGISGAKKLNELSVGEATDLCNYIGDLQGPPRTVDCGGGNTYTTEDFDEAGCTMDLSMFSTDAPDCTATVSDAEACFATIGAFTDEELCSETTPIPPECAPVFSDACN